MAEARQEALVWYGQGNVSQDNYECLKQASYSSGPTGYIHMPLGNNMMSLPIDNGGGINQALYHSCMRAHGYQLYDRNELNDWQQKQKPQDQVGNRQREQTREAQSLQLEKAKLDQERQTINSMAITVERDKLLVTYEAKLSAYRHRLKEYYDKYGLATQADVDNAIQNRQALEDERVRRWREE